MKNLLTIVILALSGAAFAEQKTFTVGVEALEYSPHYSFENGEYKGYGAEVLQAFAKDRGYTLQFKGLPVARLGNEFVAGNLDFKYPDNPNWAGDLKKGKNVSYSDAVAQFTDGALVLPEMKGKTTIKTLGAPRGFTPWVYMGDVSAGKIKLQELDSLEAVIKSAQAKRVDAGYSNIDVAAHFMKSKMGSAGILVFDDSLPHDKSTYHLSSIKHANVVTEFNDFQKREKALIDKLKAQYGVK